MTHSPQRVLACIDGSPLSESVVRYAIWLASARAAPLTLLHTIEHSRTSRHVHHEGNLTPNSKEHLLDELSDEERQESKRLLAQGKQILETAYQIAREAGLAEVICQQRHGSLAETLIDLELDYSLVVLGIKGEDHQQDKQGLGAQIEDAIRAIHVPVFIVKTAFSIPRTLMLAYHGSPVAKKALLAVMSSPFSEMTRHVVSVQEDAVQGQKLIDEARKVLGEISPCIGKVLAGSALEALIQYQQQYQIDVTVMGAFSHGKLHGFFFGSFTTRMLLESDTNFLLVR